MRWAGASLAAVLALSLVLPSPARAANANVAALQVALGALHLYRGPVDGIAGPATRRAVRRFQRRRGLAVDGVAGPRTRRALGRRGRPQLGRRVMHRGNSGWDVAALQFMLTRRRFSPGPVDGGFGHATRRAVKRFQRAAGLQPDGLAGPATLRALRHGLRRRGRPVRGGTPRGPVRFLWPVRAKLGDRFGPRPGGEMHTGIDLAAPAGTPVGAAGVGTVSFAGWNDGGYGRLVKVRHRLGFSTWYGHLASISVERGQPVTGGTVIGTVGSSGRTTAPHLHFEARLHNVPFDPLPRMVP
jgi:murein DD-endopeptidase MepM/ murein hydrolase activator NlpD